MTNMFQVAVILSAVDKMSRVVKQAVNNGVKDMQKFGTAASKAGTSAMDFGKKSMLTGAAIALPLIAATNEAIKFEDKMADVSKVLNLANGSRELQNIAGSVKETALYLGVAAEDAAGMYANLAQGGVLQEDLANVAKIAGEIGVAFDLSSEEAGESFIKMQNAMGTTIAETKKVSDAINFLSDSQASKASEILTFMASGGSGVSRTLGLAGQDMAAFGSSMISVGISANEAATTMERFQKGVLNPKNAANATYKKAGEGLNGLMAVLREGMKTKDPFTYFSQFGEYGTKIMLMGQTMNGPGGLVDALKSVSDGTTYADSVTKEFANRQNTTAGQIKKMKTELQLLAVDVGTVLLPALKEFLTALKPIVEDVLKWVRANPELTYTIAKVVGILSAVTLAVGAASFLFGGMLKIIGGASQILSLFSAATRTATLAQWGFNASALANPYVLIAIAIIAVIAAMIAMYIWFDELNAKIKEIWNSVGPLGKALMILFAILNIGWVVIYGIVAAIRWLVRNWDDLKAAVSAAADNTVVKMGLMFLAFINPITRMIGILAGLRSLFFGAGRNIISSLIDGLKSRAGALIDNVKGVAKRIRNFFPFSPAKEGPLRDIHRIKLVETIAKSVKPMPLVSAMRTVAAQARAAIPQATALTPQMAGAAMSGGGGQVVLNFSPTINVSGGGASTPDDFMAMLRKYEPELLRLVESAWSRKNRTNY